MKGEETADLSSRLLELKNFLLDQQLFETKYAVTRVPINSIVLSQTIKAAISEKDTLSKNHKKHTIERKELIISFIKDTQKYGEYFLQIQTPEESEQPSDDIGDLLSTKPKILAEKKLIPALDIKSIETVDALTFTIILHDDCLLNCYDIVEPSKTKKNNRTSSLITAFGSLMNGGSSQNSDGGFPMAFESEHVPQIIQCYQKLYSLAYSRQQELNQRWEVSQQK